MHLLLDARVIQDHFPGIGRYAFNLVRELPTALDPNETATVLMDSAATNTRFPSISNLAVPGRIAPKDIRVPLFGAANLMANLCRHAPASNIAHYCYYVRPLRSTRPAITTIYDAISFVYPNYVPGLKNRLMIGLLHRLAVLRSDAIITISQSAAKDLQRFFPTLRKAGRVHVTPLAAGDEMRPQDDAERQRVPSKLGLPNQFVLYLASNKPHKNIPALIHAWRDVLAQLPTAPTLVIAGHQDPRFGEPQTLARELGLADRIKFMGEVAAKDQAALYSACTFFIYPSLYEGFGLTPLEAMACGAPVMCSNASSLPEVCGDAALLFDPHNTHEIAQACLQLLQQPQLRDDYIQRSLRQAAKFSWSRTAQQTVQIYRTMLTH